MAEVAEIDPLLMFEGRAQEAMDFYLGLFGGEVVDVARYGAEGPGPEGTILHARFRIRGQMVRCMDSPIKHDFTFTPSVSLFVTCRDEDDVRRLAGALLEGGEALMPLGEYGFSRLYAWVNDRFGFSWQLFLE